MIQVVVEARGHKHPITVPKTMTSKQLLMRIRRGLSLPVDYPLNVIYVQHKVIQDNDRTLWSLGMRFMPNHVAMIPDHIGKGDQINMQYVSVTPERESSICAAVK